MDHILQTKGIDLRGNKKAYLKLRYACKEAKILLSNIHETIIYTESLLNSDEDFEYNLTRALFDELCDPIFDRCFPLLE